MSIQRKILTTLLKLLLVISMLSGFSVAMAGTGSLAQNVSLSISSNCLSMPYKPQILEDQSHRLEFSDGDDLQKFTAYMQNPILLAYKNAFVFSPKRLRWYAYGSSGRVIKSGKASGGKGYCRDVKRACRTPVGHFRVYSKGGPGCRSSKYPLGKGGAPMPYCTFFRGNYAIHGTNDLPNYNASHGCIRVSPASAKWLSKNFLRHGTRVIVLPY